MSIKSCPKSPRITGNTWWDLRLDLLKVIFLTWDCPKSSPQSCLDQACLGSWQKSGAYLVRGVKKGSIPGCESTRLSFPYHAWPNPIVKQYIVGKWTLWPVRPDWAIFWNFLVTNLITKVVQMLGDFVGSCENYRFLSRTGEATLPMCNFWKNLGYFCFNIRSHWPWLGCCFLKPRVDLL